MKLTKSKLDQIIKEELSEIIRIRNPKLEDRMRDVRQQLGDDAFFRELVDTIPDNELSRIINTIATNQGLTIGGVRYF
jgi:hypothetical protein